MQLNTPARRAGARSTRQTLLDAAVISPAAYDTFTPSKQPPSQHAPTSQHDADDKSAWENRRMRRWAQRTKRRSDVSPDAHAFEVEGALAVSGLSRSALYRLLADGKIEARKHGRRLLIVGDSLRAFLRDLPKASFRGAGKAP